MNVKKNIYFLKECGKNINKYQQNQIFTPDYSIDPQSFRVVIEKTLPINNINSLIPQLDFDDEINVNDIIKNLVENECKRIYEDFGITAKFECTSLESNNPLINLKNFSIEFQVSSFATILDTPCSEKSFDILCTLIQNLFREKQKQLDVSSILSNVLASKACRYAIKFNDDISKCEMNLSKTLALLLCECRDPYHCAHGRPSLYPICDIKLL